jgi:double-strand break repair protein MRE11
MEKLRISLVTGLNLDQFIEKKELGKDPFKNLNEIFSITKKQNCDFMIILGDLFNKPNPSNTACATALSYFKKGVLGKSKTHNFSLKGSKVNYLNSGLKNIELPIFAIHGEKDSPSIESVISPLEILGQSNYINYVGKVRKSEKGPIIVKPIIVKKGPTKLALYFLSYMKEVSLSKYLAQKMIQFSHPGEEGCMKVLVISQKRNNGSLTKTFPTLDIHLGQIPSFFDFVIWGDDSVKENTVEQSEFGFSVAKVGPVSLCSLRRKELRERMISVVEFYGKKISFENHKMRNMRPYIYMRLTADFIDINNNQDDSLRSEKLIEKDVIQRLGNYYQQEQDLVKPIMRVLIQNKSKKYLRLRPIEDRLKGLIANDG